MGITNAFRFLSPAAPLGTLSRPDATPVLARTDTSAITDALYELIADRIAAFTITDARKLDSVIRAKALLCGTAASFLPLAYVDGVAMERQPRIVSRPDPFHTRYEHVAQTVDGLIEDGCSFWRLGDLDPESGLPRLAYVIPHDDVQVSSGENPLIPVYVWRGTRLYPGRDLAHITIGRRPGELHGRGPLREGLQSLATVAAAEEYARAWFAGGGAPPVILKALTGPLTDTEAQRAKAQWIASRNAGSEPAVFGKDWDISFPSTDPQKSQMQEARAYGTTVVARLLGIPAALLHVETSGATIVYTNAAGAMEELVKSTLAPGYLAPIESAWSDLTPRTQVVRFDLADMQRADIAARFALYASGIASGFMTAPEARASEGWSDTAADTAHAFDPSPAFA